MSLYIRFNRYPDPPQYSAGPELPIQLPIRRGDWEVRRYDGFPTSTWERWVSSGSQMTYLEESDYWRSLFIQGTTVWHAAPVTQTRKVSA